MQKCMQLYGCYYVVNILIVLFFSIVFSKETEINTCTKNKKLEANYNVIFLYILYIIFDLVGNNNPEYNTYVFVST